MSDLCLFRTYPGLQASVPRRAFVTVPTPVEPFDIQGVPPGVVFVKRDDRSCAIYGGNKPRKLEFLLGHALTRGSRRVVTAGGLGTNHGLALTLLGSEAGLKTSLILVNQPVTSDVKRKIQLFSMLGAELRQGKNVPAAAAQALGVLARASLRGERPTWVPPGGASPRGNLGFVSAALELAEQVSAGELPEPKRIFVALGTGGTLAGLLVGLRLAGLSSRPVAVLVNDILPPSRRSLVRTARATLRMLRKHDPAVPQLDLRADDFDYVTTQLGDGYGAATAAAREAVRIAAEQGIRLETTYTGKALAALLSASEQDGFTTGPVLFWNTYNSIELPDAIESKVPASFEEFLSASCTE